MLEKNENYIEFYMHSMMVAHSPYNEDTEITITGMAPGKSLLLANNPFDIPCEVVMVPKKEFEKLQTENEQLKKKLHEFDSITEFKEFLKKLYSTEDIENLEWVLNHACGGRGSVGGWIAVSAFWKQNCETLSKLVGFSSVEEIEDYLTNEAKCDTLHEAIDNLDATVKSYRDMFDDCEPAYVKQRVDEMKDIIISYTGQISEWREATGCSSPSAAKTLIESGASWHHAYNKIKEKNRKLADDVKSWQKATGYSTSEALLSAVCNDPDNVWRDATGCDSPQEAGCKINRLCDDICKLKGDYDHLLKLTGYESEDCIRVLFLSTLL